MKNAACYIRVSTNMQEELSPDAQKRLLNEYASKNDILVSSQYVFIENGISGKKADKRPEFQKMIGLAKSKDHPIDVILVWKFSRFARNQEESIVYKSLLKKNNVEVISVSEPIIDGPFGSLIERIIEWMDEYYSIRLSGEVTRGMTENALRGNFQASPPLGYRIDRKGEPPIIVPEEAEIIKLIFDKYVNDDLSYYEIAKLLNSIGFVTKSGGSFERRAIEYIVTNPMYKGWIRWNRTHNETNTIKDKSEWIISVGSHEPIVSAEIWDKAQVKFMKNYKPKNARPEETYNHFLSGMVKCSNCGSSLSATRRKTGRIDFQCIGYNKGKCSVSHYISGNKLIPAVIAAMEEVIISGKVNFKVVSKTDVSNTNIIKKQLSVLSTKMQRAKGAYISGIDTMEEYKENKRIIDSEKEELEKKLKGLIKDKDPVPQGKMVNRIESVYQVLTSDVDNLAKNKAIKRVVEMIVFIKDENTVDLYYYYS